MAEKLTWQEIKQRYVSQWVELVDYEWDPSEANPRSGVVRNHGEKRKEIHERFMKDPVEDSAIVYTGPVEFPEGTVFSANLHQFAGVK